MQIHFRFNFSQAGGVELFSKDCSIKISPRGSGYDPCTGPIPTGDDDNGAWKGVKRMIGKLVTSSASCSENVPTNEVQQASLDTVQLEKNVSESNPENTTNKIPVLIKHLAFSKRKIERQICNLLAVVFDEQLSNDGRENFLTRTVFYSLQLIHLSILVR